MASDFAFLMNYVVVFCVLSLLALRYMNRQQKLVGWALVRSTPGLICQ